MRDWMLLIVDAKTNHSYNFADHNNTCSEREREREIYRQKSQAIMGASPTIPLTSHLSL
jgi:hypothetical protein